MGLLTCGLGQRVQAQVATSDSQLQTQLLQMVAEKNVPAASALARQILSRDPLQPSQIYRFAGMTRTMINPSGFPNPRLEPDLLRNDALRALKTLDRLDDYIAEILKKLGDDPGSRQLNWQAGEAYATASDLTREFRFLLPVAHWLKVTRQGSEFTAFRSTNGTDWTSVGHATVSVGPSLLVGVWVQRNAPVPLTASFGQFAIEGNAAGGAGPPPAWQEAEVGNMATLAGSMQPGPGPGDLVVTGGSGQNRLDSGHFVYRTMEGDGSVVVRLPDLESVPEDATLGLMLRASLDSDFPVVRFIGNRRQGLQLSYKVEPKRWLYAEIASEVPSSGWFKLGRMGDRLTASFSTDGANWLPVFSHRLNLGSRAMAGVLSINDDEATRNFSWSSLGVSEAGVAPTATSPKGATAPGALPPPWQFSPIGAGAAGSLASWSDRTIVLTVPGYTASYTPRKYFLHRPLSGDGEVSAFMPAGQGLNESTFTALAFRGSLVGTDVEVRFGRLGATDILEFDIEGGGQREAAEYFTRAAAAGPPNPRLVVAAALYDLLVGRAGDAVAAFVSLFKADPAAAMSIVDNVGEVFEQSGQIPELATMVETLSPWGVSGQGTHLASLVTSLSDKTKKNHPAESARFFLKAVDLAGSPTDEASLLTLAGRLQLAGQREAAASLLEKYFAREIAPGPTTGGSAATLRRVLFNGNSYGTGNGQFTLEPTVDLLAMAVELGLGEKLRAGIGRRDPIELYLDAAQEATDDLFGIMLRIESRDPAYWAQMDQFLKTGKAATLPNGGVIHLGMLAQELARWPEERPAAARIMAEVLNTLQTLVTRSQVIMRSRLAPMIARQSAELGVKLDDRTMVASGLRTAAEELTMGLSQPGGLALGGTPLVHDLIAAGMLAEADDLIQAFHTAATTQNGGPGLSGSQLDRQLQSMQTELDQAKAGTVDTRTTATGQADAKPPLPPPSGPNLLPNPGFVTERSLAGVMAVPGWNWLRPGRTIREYGGPDTRDGYATLVPLASPALASGGSRVESGPISVSLSGAGYTLSGLTAGITRFTFAFLDADRKPLGQPTSVPVSKSTKDPWKQYSIRLAGASEGGAAPDVVIPPGSAFLVLGLGTGDEFKLAGLRLEKTDK